MIWKTTKIEVNKLHEWDKNPRKMTEKGLKNLVESIKKFGLAEPLVVNVDGVVIGGHGRIIVLKKLGIKEANCYVPDHQLTPGEFKELNIRLNANIAGEWNFEELSANWDIEELEEWGLDLDWIGKENEGEIEDDEIPDEDKTPKRCKLGDLWQLGTHRLMCGDSTKKENVEKLMNGERADMVFTDPPYGINLEYTGCMSKKTNGKIKNDDVPFNPSSIFEIKAKSYYIWGADYFLNEIRKINNNGSIFVWAKRFSEEENKVLGNSFEICWRFPKRKKELWFIRSINQCGNERLGKHPSQKPIELATRAINLETKEEDIIVDFFGGSGSTLIACEKTNRKCYMMELDEHYSDIIIQRWEIFSGKKAIKINNKQNKKTV